MVTKTKKRVNPLLTDPTRTTLLRRRFVSDLHKRIRRLKGKIRKLAIEEDAFGLVGDRLRRRVLGNSLTTNQRWRFLTDEEKLREFEKWLQQEIELEIFAGATQEEIDQAYWYQYIQEGYQKGWARSFDDVNSAGLTSPSPEFFQGSRQEFLRQSFGPQSVERTKLIASRVFTDLKGFSDATSQQLQRNLADGFTQGKGPREIASDLSKTVDNLEKKRARTIARTEVIRAHAEGQLDSIEAQGLTQVGVQVEWSTTGDDLVCPLCQPLEGIVITTKEARGILPRHPNCRCSFLPANVGETKDGSTKETRAEVQEAIDESIKQEIPKGDKDRTVEEQKERSKWVGADVKPASRRPEPKLQPRGDAVTKRQKPRPKPTEPVAKEKPSEPPKTVSKAPQPVKRPDNKGLSVKGRIQANEEAEKVRLKVIELGDKADARVKQIEQQISDNYHRASDLVKRQIQLNNEVVASAEELGLTISQYESQYPHVIQEIADLDKVSDELTSLNTKLSKELTEARTERLNITRQALRVGDNVENLSVSAVQSKPGTIVKSVKPEVNKTLTAEHARRTQEAADFVGSVTAADTEVGAIRVKSYQLRKDYRAHAIDGMNISGLEPFDAIYCTQDDGIAVFVHELGHHIEYKLPEVRELAKEFLDYRTEGHKVEYYKKLYPRSRYKADERGAKDEFDRAFDEHSAWYIGKQYGRNSTEIVSMGLQKLYEDPIGFARLDPEYFNFMVGILRRTL